MLIDLPGDTKIAFEKLKDAQKILRAQYKEFSFTLDGKLIGDIGEAIILSQLENSKKLKDSNKCHDLLLPDGTCVQVKTTQKDIMGLGLKKQSFEHLVIIRIYEDGKYEIVFDGPGEIVYANSSKSNNISIELLRKLYKHNGKKIIGNGNNN